MKTQSCLKLAAAVMRLGVLAILPALFVSTLSAQDRIVLKNGNTLEAKVQEIQVSEIKYKRFDNLNGPVYSLLKSDVFLIMYENGTKEVISELRAAPAAAQTVKSSNQIKKTQQPAAAHAPKQMRPSGPSFYTGTGANSSVAFYGTAWLGADYNFFTGDFKDTDKTVSIAYGGGAGLLFGNVFDLGVRILNHTAETGTAMLQLSAGIRF